MLLFRMANKAPELTAERLRELLHYDPDTGHFTWRVASNNRITVGAKAGSDCGKAGWIIGIDGCTYQGPRLAWLHILGEWPAYTIKCRNERPIDLRWSNLYALTPEEKLKRKACRLKAIPPLTATRLREVLHYDPDAGVFTWLVDHARRRIKTGSIAGRSKGDTGGVIRIDWRLYGARRLAWLYMTGAWPDDPIESRNEYNPGDLRWASLFERKAATGTLIRKRRKPKELLSAERLRERLHYDPATGAFTWRVAGRGKRKAGDPAGSLHQQGYIHIKLDRHSYKAHHLAWLYVHGEWPKRDLDHKDTIRHHNWIDNLREATDSQNCANASLSSRNSSGFKGVSFDRKRNCWSAWIRKDRRGIFLGRFDTPEEAHAAYCEAAKRLQGDFARTA